MSFIHRNIINIYISYELDTWPIDLNSDFMLANCLFGALKLTKNTDPDKYGYSGSGIGFDAVYHFYCQVVSGVKMLLFLVQT